MVKNQWSMWEEVMPFKPDLFFYLKPDLSIAMERLRKRNRKGEEGITLEYQINLEYQHDCFFGSGYVDNQTDNQQNKERIPVVKIENNGDIRTDELHKKEISDIVLHNIKCILNSNKAINE
jgi:thymidylate kinase